MTAKELKLRLINEPLNYEEINHSATCCSCCKHAMDTLSKEERVIKLSIGYLRIYSSMIIPADISSLIIDYVGSASGFTYIQLLSDKELKRLERPLRNKQLYTKYCQSCKCYIDICKPNDIGTSFDYFWCYPAQFCPNNIFCGYGGIFTITLRLIFLTYFIGKDISLLVINSNNNCYGQTDDISFDVHLWIQVAAITHLSTLFILSLFAFVGGCWLQITYSNKEDTYVMSIGVCYGCIWLFFTSWMVIGFVLHSQMNDSNEEEINCKNVVVSWCIMQVTECIIGPLCVFSCIKSFISD